MRVVGILIVVAACGDNLPGDKTAACELATSRSAATVESREAIGPAAPYVPDLTLDEAVLARSIAARRAAAWAAVGKVLAPVPLGDPRLASNFGGTQPTIPAWHTWYASDDFTRSWKHAYRDLGTAGRKARAPIDGAAALAWDATALDGLPDWPEQRYLDYLATITDQVTADGVGDANRVSYSPGAMTHLLESYAKQYACRIGVDPDPFAPDATKPGSLVAQRDAVAIDGCEFRVLGPYLAAPGASVTVTSSGDGDADLYVRRGGAPDAATYDCKSAGDSSDERCVVDGGAPIYVAVFGAKPAAVDLTVEYLTADVADPTCLDGAMPRDAVLAKGDWRRVLPGETIPTFDSSGRRMATRLASDAAAWDPDGTADPHADSIYTVTLESGQQFRLPALHIMTKELDHWLWITLWWSPAPDTDFGADRPASLGGVWRNYKMCTSSAYVESDPDPRGGQAGTLGDALAAVNGGVGAPSWCSNPYLELGDGNATTNCIGCHQHGGTALTPEMILATEPHHGATRQRNNFFTDYLWAIKGGRGEELSSIVQAEIEFWDASE